jgi:GntR family transcriptional regulator
LSEQWIKERQRSRPREALLSGSLAPSTTARLPTPLYHRVYLVLRERIASGRYGPDGRLPSEFEIMAEFGVARVTARRALGELEAEGLVERGRGRGTRLRPGASVREVRATLEGLFENLLTMGLETRVRLLAAEDRPAPAEIARALEVEPGSPVLHAIRLRLLDDGPFSHLSTWIPGAVAARLRRTDLAHKPLLSLLEEAGIEVASADQTVSATLAEPPVAALLEVPVGAPLLVVERLVRERGGRPVEHITGLYRPDRYRLRLSLARAKGEPGPWVAGGGAGAAPAGERTTEEAEG